MIVALAKLVLHIEWAQSLKDKRAAVRKLCDKTRAKYGVLLAEVGGQDTWQRAELGLAVVGNDRTQVSRVVDRVVALIEREGIGQLVSDDRELVYFGDPLPGEEQP